MESWVSPGDSPCGVSCVEVEDMVSAEQCHFEMKERKESTEVGEGHPALPSTHVPKI